MAQGTGLPLDKVGGEVVQGPGALQSTDPGAAAWGRIAGAGEKLESIGFNQLTMAEYQRAVGSEIDSDNKDAEAKAKIMSTLPKDQWAGAFQEYSAGRMENADSRDALNMRRKHGQTVNQLRLTAAAETAADNERIYKEDISKGFTRVGSDLEGIAGAGKMGTKEWDDKLAELQGIGKSAEIARLHSPQEISNMIEDVKTNAMGQVAIRSAETVYANEGYDAAVKHLQENIRDNDELKMSTAKRFATYGKGLAALRQLKLADAGGRKEVVDGVNDLVAQMETGVSLIPGVYENTLAAARKVGALPSVNKLIIAKTNADYRMQTAGMTLQQQAAFASGAVAQKAQAIVGPNYVPTLAQARQPFAGELQNDALRRRLIAYVAAEAGHKDTESQLAFIESSMNRANARGDTLDSTLPATGRVTPQGRYFPKETHANVRGGVSQQDYERYSGLVDIVLGGSNVAKYATGNASLTTGFGYGRGANDPYFLKTRSGERYGPENNSKDLSWISQMRAAEGGASAIPFTPGTQPGATPAPFVQDPSARATLIPGVPVVPGAVAQPRGAAGPTGDQPGLIEPGNIDLAKRPVVTMPDGKIATVRSMSFNEDGKEVLIPTISDDGKVLSEKEAIANYKETGKHLGKFKTSDEATEYAKKLSAAQGAYYAKPAAGTGAQPATGPAASPAVSAPSSPAAVANNVSANPDAAHAGRVGLAVQQAFVKDVKANWGAGADYKKQMERMDPSVTPEFIAALRQAGAMAALTGDTKFQKDIEEAVLTFNAKRGLKTIPLASDQLAAIDELGQQIKDHGGTSMSSADVTDALVKQVQKDTKLATDDPVTFFKQNTPGAQIDPLNYSNPAALQRGIQQRIFAAEATATEKQLPRGNPFMEKERDELAGVISGPDRKAAAQAITALNSLSPEMVGAVMKGGANNPVRAAILGAAVGSDPIAMTAANQFLDKQYREDPNGFEGKFGDKAYDNLQRWQGWKDSYSAPEISERFQKAMDPAQQKVDHEVLKQVNETELKSVDVGFVVGKMGGWFKSGAPQDFYGIRAADGQQSARMVSEYKANYTNLRRDGVPADKAEKLAADKLGLKYGYSDVDGKIMAYPPDKYFGEVDGSRSYISKQLNDAIDQYGLKGLRPEAALIARAQRDQPYELHALVADARTETELPTFDNPHRRPSYNVVLLNRKTGDYELMKREDGNDRFTFDEEAARQESIARINRDPFQAIREMEGTAGGDNRGQFLTPQQASPTQMTPEFEKAVTADLKQQFPDESDEQIAQRVQAVAASSNTEQMGKVAQDFVPGAAEFGVNADAFADAIASHAPSRNVEVRKSSPRTPPTKPTARR